MQHILLIDDDVSFRRMLRLTLARLGYAVREAANGREAMRNFGQGPTHLVITDLIMPEKEGLETIQELHRVAPDVKIIAMSGGGNFASQDLLVIAKLFGAHRTLVKPFTKDELTTALDDLLVPAGGAAGKI